MAHAALNDREGDAKQFSDSSFVHASSGAGSERGV
jgi:hypothetical protein